MLYRFREIWDLVYRAEFLDVCILGFPDCHRSEVLEPERAAYGFLNLTTREAKRRQVSSVTRLKQVVCDILQEFRREIQKVRHVYLCLL